MDSLEADRRRRANLASRLGAALNPPSSSSKDSDGKLDNTAKSSSANTVNTVNTVLKSEQTITQSRLENPIQNQHVEVREPSVAESVNELR